MAKLRIAFDVDGTLINRNDEPRQSIINTLECLYFYADADITVWSGGGKQYAEMWGGRLGLPNGIIYAAKSSMNRQDIAFDDEDVTALADKVIQVNED